MYLLKLPMIYHHSLCDLLLNPATTYCAASLYRTTDFIPNNGECHRQFIKGRPNKIFDIEIEIVDTFVGLYLSLSAVFSSLPAPKQRSKIKVSFISLTLLHRYTIILWYHWTDRTENMEAPEQNMMMMMIHRKEKQTPILEAQNQFLLFIVIRYFFLL